MKVVVGLGNPGARYHTTRHNVGFSVIEALAQRWQASRPRRRFEGELSEAVAGSERVLLVAPQTWMNASGRCVAQVVHFYQIARHELLVVCDDLALPLGKLRLRRGGSAGGHKGLKDIIAQLGSDDYSRLRIGIGEAPENWDAADWVLSRFSSEELPVIGAAVQQAAQAAEVWVTEGIEAVMNRFN